jgi:quercetin dioxygenase-like cupin family protein
MKLLDTRTAARDAVAPRPDRPATAVIHDGDDARLVVFRLAPGQQIAPHRNASTVMLLVLEGHGVLSGEHAELPCSPGDLVVYAPDELHGMRAVDDELLLLATITPRPGSRAAPIDRAS